MKTFQLWPSHFGRGQSGIHTAGGSNSAVEFHKITRYVSDLVTKTIC